MENEIFQDSVFKKNEWLIEIQKSFPKNAKVKIIKNDIKDYIGMTGVVANYDIGKCGDWPLITVKFDNKIMLSGSMISISNDGFYDDELELI